MLDTEKLGWFVLMLLVLLTVFERQVTAAWQCVKRMFAPREADLVLRQLREFGEAWRHDHAPARRRCSYRIDAVYVDDVIGARATATFITAHDPDEAIVLARRWFKGKERVQIMGCHPAARRNSGSF